jgi:glycosyltransferase involved in cell wall biosynthesis
MHVLIIPGEELNEKNQLGSVFEIHQARVLSDLNFHVGFISTNLKGSIYKEIKDALKEFRFPRHNDFKISYQKLNGIDLIEVMGKYLTPSFLKLYRKERVKAGVKAYLSYVEKFGKPDIIHAHSRFLDSALIANEIFKLYQTPFVFTEHSTFHQRNLVSKKEYFEYAEIIKYSKKWIVVSQSLGEIISTKLKAINKGPSKKYFVLPNVIDPEFKLKSKESTIGGRFIFLNIASLDAKKNHELLIKSFKKVIMKNPNVELRIGGEGELEKQLKDKVQELNLSQIIFLGRLSRNQVEYEMLNSHAFVLSSDVETFGVVLIESLALGKPIIATRSGGPEYIVNGKNGFLVEPKNVDDLSNAMLSMIEKYENFNPKSIQDDCFENYGPKVIGKKLIEIYKEALI